MLHVCAVKFDVTKNFKIFLVFKCELNKALVFGLNKARNNPCINSKERFNSPLAVSRSAPLLLSPLPLPHPAIPFFQILPSFRSPTRTPVGYPTILRGAGEHAEEGAGGAGVAQQPNLVRDPACAHPAGPLRRRPRPAAAPKAAAASCTPAAVVRAGRRGGWWPTG